MKTIQEALTILGEQKDVARFLQSRGCITPIFYDRYSCSCPVAIYLEKETGRRAMVGGPRAALGDVRDGAFIVDKSTEVIMPPSVELFVDRFDQGCYPFLDEASNNVA